MTSSLRTRRGARVALARGLALALVGGLTACSSASAPSSPSGAPGTSGTSGPSGASAAGGSGPCDGKVDGPVTVKVATHVRNDPTMGDKNPAKVYAAAFARFNSTVGAEKKITAEFVNFGEANYEDGVQKAIQRGDQVDVLEMDAQDFGPFAFNKLVQPLGTCWTDAKKATMTDPVVANGQYQGKQWAIGAYNSGMSLFVSKKALAKVGATLPTSPEQAWKVEDFDALLTKLKAAGYPTPLNIEWAYGAGEYRPFAFGPALLSAGSGLLSPDLKTATGHLNSDASVKAMTWFQKWNTAGLIDRAGTEAGNDANFTGGTSAISWIGHWKADAYKKALGDDLALVPLPDFGQGTRAYGGTWTIGIGAKTKDADAAWAVIDFLTSADGAAKQLIDSESAIPGVKALFDADPAYKPGGDRYLYAQLMATPGVIVPRPQTPAYLPARDEFSKAFGEIVDGADPKATLDQAAKAADDAIEAGGFN